MSRFPFLLLFVCCLLSPLQGMYLDHLTTPEQTPLVVKPKPTTVDLSNVPLSPGTLVALMKMFDEEADNKASHNKGAQTSLSGSDNPSEKFLQGVSAIKRRSSGTFDDSLFEAEAPGTTPVNASCRPKGGVKDELAQDGLEKQDERLTKVNSSHQSTDRAERVNLLKLLDSPTEADTFYEGNLEESQYGFLDESSQFEQEERSGQLETSILTEERSNRGATGDCVDFAVFFPLHGAVSQGDIKGVLQLIAEGTDLGEKNMQGQTALHAAVEADNKELCETLLNAGAQIDAQDMHGWTALHRATVLGFSQIVSLLLVRKADLEARSLKGWTALHCACWHGQAEAAALLLTAHAQLEALCEGNNTPLHFATWRDKADLSKLLVFCGASIVARNSSDATPFHYAAYQGNREIVALILSQAADIYITTSMGNTPLHCAAWRGHSDVVRFLLELGAPHTLNKKGESPLHCAVYKGHKEVIEVLLEYSPLEEIPSGVTVLHSAASGNQASLIPYLLTLQGVQRDAQDYLGRTAYFIAMKLGFKDVAQALLGN